MSLTNVVLYLNGLVWQKYIESFSFKLLKNWMSEVI